MKFDKKNPLHWLILLWSSTLLIVLLPLRLLKPLKKQRSVIFFGHKLNGNILALYEYAKAHYPEMDTGYLSVDPAYIKQLRGEYTVVNGLSIRGVAKLVLSDAVIADHGAQQYRLLQKLTNMVFIDVWHGIPYKGFDADDFAHLHSFDQTWVSSPWAADMYHERLGFRPEQIKVTGYARAYRLRHYPYSREQLLKKYGLEDKKTILVAPTWKQDAANRSIVPFGLTLTDFFDAIKRSYDGEIQIIFRAHLNVAERHVVEDESVKIMPFAEYPIAEDFLMMSDVLLTDWSSIAFDSLAIHQPVVFMDVEPPFKKGFFVEPRYRFGATPAAVATLQKTLHQALHNPQQYLRQYDAIMKESKKLVYGDTLENDVCKRSFELLFTLLENKKRAK